MNLSKENQGTNTRTINKVSFRKIDIVYAICAMLISLGVIEVSIVLTISETIQNNSDAAVMKLVKDIDRFRLELEDMKSRQSGQENDSESTIVTTEKEVTATKAAIDSVRLELEDIKSNQAEQDKTLVQLLTGFDYILARVNLTVDKVAALFLLQEIQGVTQNESEAAVMKLEKDIDSFRLEFEDMKSKQSEQETSTTNRSNVFFTARLHSSGEYSNGEIIVFGNIISSKGGAYDARTGIFTAPREGVYLFSMTTMVHTNGYAVVYLKKNNDNIGYMLADARRDGYHDSRYATGSVTVTVELVQGDRVYTQSISGSGHLHTYSVFTGVLLNFGTQL